MSLRNIVDLKGQIDEATEELGKDYREALRNVKRVKEKITGLELSISQKRISTGKEIVELRSAEESLDELTDHQITRSIRIWEVYKQLERDCGERGFAYRGLEDLRVLCKKTEELSSDLLCYVLARFKRRVERDIHEHPMRKKAKAPSSFGENTSS